MRGMLWGRAASNAALVFVLYGCSPPSSPDAGDTLATDAADVQAPRDGDSTSMDVTIVTDGGMSCGASFEGCDPVTNRGCSAGQACVLTGPTTAMCSPAGTGGFGEPCSSASDCREGMACLGAPLPDGGVDRRCRLLCCGPEDFERCRDESRGGIPGARCDVRIGGSSLFACSSSVRCDWLAQDCPMEQNCLAVDRAGNTICVTPGTTPEGGTCSSANECMRGFVCIGPMNEPGTCRQICNPMSSSGDAGGPACPAGMTCMGLSNAPPTFGFCGM